MRLAYLGIIAIVLFVSLTFSTAYLCYISDVQTDPFWISMQWASWIIWCVGVIALVVFAMYIRNQGVN